MSTGSWPWTRTELTEPMPGSWRTSPPGFQPHLVNPADRTPRQPPRHKPGDIRRWRYRLFATAGKIIIRARRNQLLPPDSAPEKKRPDDQPHRKPNRHQPKANQLATSPRSKTENHRQATRKHETTTITDHHEKSRLARLDVLHCWGVNQVFRSNIAVGPL